MSRDRGICFTVNNYTDTDIKQTQYALSTADYGIMGYEIAPTTGTQHLQCYGYWKNKMSFKRLCEHIPRASCRLALGSAKQNQVYYSKEGKYEEFGTLTQQGERTDIEEFRDAILSGMDEEDLLMQFAGCMARYDRFYQRCRNIVLKKQAKLMIQPEVIVIEGDTGTGKTHTVYAENDINDVYKVEVGDGSSGSVFWDSYSGEKVILIDDFHSNLKLDYMLRLLDKYPMKLNIKGGHTWKCAEKIYITTNVELDRWYPNCHVRHRNALLRRITKHLVLRDPQAQDNTSIEQLYQTFSQL